MKTKAFSIFTVLLAGGALLIPACSDLPAPSIVEEEEDIDKPTEQVGGDDLINYKGRPFRAESGGDDDIVLPNVGRCFSSQSAMERFGIRSQRAHGSALSCGNLQKCKRIGQCSFPIAGHVEQTGKRDAIGTDASYSVVA